MKKAVLAVGAVALAASLMFIQPIQSLAVSALSVFRVENAKTIQITMSDIEELLALLDEHKEEFDEAEAAEIFSSMKHEELEPLTLNDINEFTAFRVSLPKELEEQEPLLTMMDSQTKSYTIDTAKLNEMAAKAGILGELDAGYDNETITLTTSPVLWADYENVRLMASQGPYLESPGELNQEVWDILLELPGIPENIRSQLTEIDINARDVYLPVVMGVGREVDLGGTTGYIYASSDIGALAESLTGELNSSEYNTETDAVMDGENTAEEINTLIWVKDNVLYLLTGSVSDDGLAKIARSVK